MRLQFLADVIPILAMCATLKIHKREQQFKMMNEWVSMSMSKITSLNATAERPAENFALGMVASWNLILVVLASGGLRYIHRLDPRTDRYPGGRVAPLPPKADASPPLRALTDVGSPGRLPDSFRVHTCGSRTRKPRSSARQLLLPRGAWLKR